MLDALGRDRIHWLAALAVVAAINAQSAIIFEAIEVRGFVPALFSGFAVNPIFWFALFVGGAIAFSSEDAAPLRRGDGLVLALMLLMVLVPVQAVSALALLGGGAWLVATSPRGSRGRRAGAVFLVLTTSLIWGRVVLMLAGDLLVALDAGFVAWISGTAAHDNLVEFSTGGGSVMIAYACSSLHNLTMAIQMWVAMVALLCIPLSARSVLIGLAAIVANVLVNGLRLSMIVSDRATYDYWHMGAGATMFAWLAVVLVASVVMMGCYALAPRRV